MRSSTAQQTAARQAWIAAAAYAALLVLLGTMTWDEGEGVAYVALAVFVLVFGWGLSRRVELNGWVVLVLGGWQALRLGWNSAQGHVTLHVAHLPDLAAGLGGALVAVLAGRALYVFSQADGGTGWDPLPPDG